MHILGTQQILVEWKNEVVSHQENANKNNNGILPHTYSNDNKQREKSIKCKDRVIGSFICSSVQMVSSKIQEKLLLT